MNRLSVKLILLSSAVVAATLATASLLGPTGALVFEGLGALLAGAISYLAYWVNKDD